MAGIALSDNLKQMLGLSPDSPTPTKFANTTLTGEVNPPIKRDWRGPALLQLTGAVAEKAGEVVGDAALSLTDSPAIAAGAHAITEVAADPANLLGPIGKGVAAAGLIGEAIKMKVPDHIVGIAKGMERAGKSADEIEKMLGIYRGPVDNKWRAVVPDDAATIKSPALVETSSGAKVMALPGTRLDQVLDHPKAYEMFPFLKWTKIEYNPKLVREALYNQNTDTIEVGTQSNRVDLIAAILHEAQHKIQIKHNLTRGSNPYEFLGVDEEVFIAQRRFAQDEFHHAYMALREKFPAFSPNRAKQPKEIINDPLYYEYQVLEQSVKSIGKKWDDAYEAYIRVGGEGESGAVEAMFKNAQLPRDKQNAASLPLRHYPVPLKELTHPPTGVKVNRAE